MEELRELFTSTLEVFNEHDEVAQWDSMLYGEFDRDRGFVKNVMAYVSSGRRLPTNEEIKKINFIKQYWKSKFS